MKDQVMTIKTHTESSKSELSSRSKRRFKVFCFSQFFWAQAVDYWSMVIKPKFIVIVIVIVIVSIIFVYLLL